MRRRWGAVTILASFALMAAGLAVALRLMHRRSITGLIGPFDRVRQHFRVVAGVLILFQVVMLPFALLSPEVSLNTGLATRLAYWPLGLVALLIQTGTEELVFRGYLQQQLAARFRSPLIWIGLPSLMFGLLHYAPQAYGPNAVAVVIWAVVFAAIAADLTARTGSLGAAIGLHFATNFGSVLVVGVQGRLDGLALYAAAIDTSDPATMLPVLVAELAYLVVTWLLIRVILRV